MIHHHTVWQLMRNHTQRQVGDGAVQELTEFINNSIDNFVKNVVDECELLLLFNGIKTSRISSDTIKGVIKRKNNIPLPVSTGGKGDIKRKGKKISHLPNEVKYYE